MPLLHNDLEIVKEEAAASSGNPYAGTQTEKNLETAFAGESQARNKYTYFASVAKKEGYEQIADLFLKTAENEKEHTKVVGKGWVAAGDLAVGNSIQAPFAKKRDAVIWKRYKLSIFL